MINDILKSNFPFISDYFETLIQNNIDKFPQSIVFEGLDIISEYMFSMELARILNCKGDKKDSNCKCINCNWIRDIKHPSVNIVSPINFKDDPSKTVISIAQAKKITSSLSETCDYHRVFIFCDAKIKQKNAAEEASCCKFKSLGYDFPEENWVPLPLNMKMFQADASNSLLKSVEEPPDRTTFIFLTKNREDLISTIVSRSNVFKLSGGGARSASKEAKPYFDDIKMLKKYPYFTIEEALETVIEIENKLKADEINPVDFFNDLEDFILSNLKNNINNIEAVKLFEYHIKLILKAKRRLKAFINIKFVLESLFLDFARQK